jgi:hypothetical protein
MPRVVALVLSMLILQGCLFHESGTWEDDPKNWKRMFGDEKPDGVTLVHSRILALKSLHL